MNVTTRLHLTTLLTMSFIAACGGAAAAEGVDAASLSTGLPIEGRDLRLVRVSADELALQFELFNGTDSRAAPVQFGIETYTGRNVLLADLPRGTAYGVLPLAGISRRITPHLRIAPGASATLTAVFSAPPDETTAMLVMIPSLEPVLVPVQPQGSGMLADSPVLDGPVPQTALVAPIVCDTAGPRQEAGAARPVEFRLSGDVVFEFGSAELSPVADDAIAAIAEQIGNTPGTLTVEGHTDSIDDTAFNQKLSEQRAAAVAAALRARLGDRFTVETMGFGESRPIAPNQHPDGSDDPDGRAQNRRVEVRLGTTEPGVPAELEPRDLGARLSDLGLTSRVAGLERQAGYLLARLIVGNPTAQAVDLPPDSGLLTGKQAPEGLTVVDVETRRRHQVCRWYGASPTIFHAGNQTLYYEDRPSRVPAGSDVTFWALYAAPPAGIDTLDVEIGGFGQVVSSPLHTQSSGRTRQAALVNDPPPALAADPLRDDLLVSAFDRTDNVYFQVVLEKPNGIDMRAFVMPEEVIAEFERAGKAVRPSRTSANVSYWGFLETGDFVTADILNNPDLANLTYEQLEELFAQAPRDGTRWNKSETLSIGRREYGIRMLDANDSISGGKKGEVEIAVLEAGRKVYYYFGHLRQKETDTRRAESGT
jgi:outer membrane protein OmpA-like peptidoglycan-associated protein